MHTSNGYRGTCHGELCFAWLPRACAIAWLAIQCCGCAPSWNRPTPIRDALRALLCSDCEGECVVCGDPSCCGCDLDEAIDDSPSPEGNYYDSDERDSENRYPPHVPPHRDSDGGPTIVPDVDAYPDPESLPPGEPTPADEELPTPLGPKKIVPNEFFSRRDRNRKARTRTPAKGGPSSPDPLAKDEDDRIYPLRRVGRQTPLKRLNPITRLIPTNDREWAPEFEKVARAEFHDDDTVTLRNVRNCRWLTGSDCVVDHYDREYDLNDLKTVDFIVVPFNGMEQIAHTMLSFGFGRGDYVGLSVEVRRERGGEEYSTTKGFINEFQLAYVVADERDLIPVRVLQRDSQVYIYRGTAPPDRVRKLFVDVMQRANKLAERPEFYNTLTNNCTTNLAQHVNNLAPGRIPYDYRILLPGYSANLAYDLGLIENRIPFEEVRQRALANERVVKHLNAPDFSQRIRR